MQQPLTKRQHEVLEFVRGFTARNGHAPSYAEIAAALDVSSLATVWKHVNELREKGRVTARPNLRRAIEITPPPDCCSTCGRKFDNAHGIEGAEV